MMFRLVPLMLMLACAPAAAQMASPPVASGTAVYQHRALYAGPSTSAITTANAPVTIFPPNSVVSGCEIFNTGAATLYVDLVTTATVGGPTSIPIPPGGSWRSPFPPVAAVTATAAAAQPFVAIRY